MLRVMSADLYQPTPHRVINTSGSKTRTSVAFFYEPVRPAPSCALCCGALQKQDINSASGHHILVQAVHQCTAAQSPFPFTNEPSFVCHAQAFEAVVQPAADLALPSKYALSQASCTCCTVAQHLLSGVIACPTAITYMHRAGLEPVRYGSHLERKVGLAVQLLHMQCTLGASGCCPIRLRQHSRTVK
jgi:hypothetical protein